MSAFSKSKVNLIVLINKDHGIWMISLFVIVADFFIACFEVSISFYRRINEFLDQLFIAFLSKGWVSQFFFDDTLF